MLCICSCSCVELVLRRDALSTTAYVPLCVGRRWPALLLLYVFVNVILLRRLG